MRCHNLGLTSKKHGTKRTTTRDKKPQRGQQKQNEKQNKKGIPQTTNLILLAVPDDHRKYTLP